MTAYEFIKKLYMTARSSGIFNVLPDKTFLVLLYRIATGQRLHLNSPVTYNEKIQWIKLYDHNPLYTKLVDKYAVRQYVKDKIGGEYLIPLLGKWSNADEIDFSILPDQYVLKCNHDSGGIVICTDKKRMNIDEARKKLDHHLKQNHYYMSREWAYKNVPRCIIAEKYMLDCKTKDLRDYKFFCTNGIPRLIQVDFNRFTDHKRNLYTLDWKLINETIKCPNDPKADLARPVNLDEMIDIAGKLSVGLPEVRVDLYSVDGKTYFGELTLYHGGGIEKFSSEEFAREMGSWIDLNLSYKV